jgi:hypothetical protein
MAKMIINMSMITTILFMMMKVCLCTAQVDAVLQPQQNSNEQSRSCRWQQSGCKCSSSSPAMHNAAQQIRWCAVLHQQTPT